MKISNHPRGSRSDFSRLFCIGVIAAVVAPPLAWSQPTSDTRPNIIVILADDMGYSDLGCFGSEIDTPNLDSLAARGLRFTQFYNCAVCCPTRAALLTGLYPHQAGVGWMVTHGADMREPGPYQGYLNERCVTLAEVLKTSAYQTLMVGKWHVGEERPHWPVDRGFDRYFGLISGAANYFDLSRDIRPTITRHMALDDKPYFPPKEGFYMTDAFADRAVEFVADATQMPQPFFLYLAFTAPHSPLHAPAELIQKYIGRYRQGWDVLRVNRHRRMLELGIVAPGTPLAPRDPGVPPWDDAGDHDLLDLKMAIWAAQVERMDAGVGKVLRKLHETGREENTLILFMSDNGAAYGEGSFREPKFNRAPYLGGPESYGSLGRGWSNACNTPLRDFKTTAYEGGIATSMIACWPRGISARGKILHEPAHVIDLMPTFVELSKANYPRTRRGLTIPPPEGRSLMPLFAAATNVSPRTLYWEFEGNRAIRDANWKLVAKEGGAWELYDLSRDRNELHNRTPEEPARVRMLAEKYESWARRCGIVAWAQIASSMKNLPP
jgi:arylsulfatase A-like enzyme